MQVGLRTPVLAGTMRIHNFCCTASYQSVSTSMSVSFRRAVLSAISKDSAVGCSCRHVSRSRNWRIQEQVRCLSTTPNLQSGHSYVVPATQWHPSDTP
jgi:hypothetical protein